MNTEKIPDPSPADLAFAKRASARAMARENAQARREYTLQRRRQAFDLIVAGCAYEEVAVRLGVSTATVRREVDLALAARAPEAADRYVALQLARLHKALRVVDEAMDDGNLRSIPALATLQSPLDRYHGIAALLAAPARRVAPLQ